MRKNRWLWVSTFGILVLFVGLAIGLIFWVGTNEPDSSTGNGDQGLEQDTAEIEPGETTTISLEVSGATAIIFHDPITISGTYSLALQEPITSSSTSQAWSRRRIISLDFFDSEGTVVPHISFENIIIVICFPLNDEDWAHMQETPIEIQVQFWNEALPSPGWEEVPTSTLYDSKRFCGIIDHLSLFALATREKEAAVETPEPDEPTPITGQAFTVEIEDPDVRLVVPSEAGLVEGTLTMTHEENNQYPEEPPIWNREPTVDIVLMDSEGNEVENPEFPSPIALCFSLTDEMWERYLLAPTEFEIHSYDERISDAEWEAIDVVENLEDQELCGAVWYPNLFALAESLSSVGRAPTPYKP